MENHIPPSSGGEFWPEDVDPTLCTHMIFSFGTIKNGELATFEPNDDEVIGRLMALKKVYLL